MEIILDRVECSGLPNFIECSDLKVKRVQRERLIFGNSTLFVPLDNSYKADVTAYVKQGGEYRLMPYKIRKAACDGLKEDIYFWDDMCKNSTHHKDRPCPYPAGIYTWNGYTPSLKNVPTAIMPSGDYRVHFALIQGSEEKFLMKVTAKVVQV
jgi:Protein of unknown function (DUF1091)